jgi:hypothetical protein
MLLVFPYMFLFYAPVHLQKLRAPPSLSSCLDVTLVYRADLSACLSLPPMRPWKPQEI